MVGTLLSFFCVLKNIDKSRFTPREEVIMVNRILRDDPTKGDMHNRQAIGASGFFKSLMDYDMWPLYVVRFVVRTKGG